MKPLVCKAEAIAEGATPEGPLEIGLANLLAGKEAPAEVVYAHSIYEDPYKSEVIEAFLLAEATPEQIERVVRVPKAVTDAYKHLFFNRAGFQDELDVEAYVQNYDDSTKELKWGKELKQAALVLGVEYLVYRFSRKPEDLDLASALKNMIASAYSLTYAAKLNPLNSNSTKEARLWMATATKALESYVRVKPATENTTDEFQIALENIERATDEARSGIKKEDILH